MKSMKDAEMAEPIKTEMRLFYHEEHEEHEERV